MKKIYILFFIMPPIPSFASEDTLIITKTTMKNCALSTIKIEDFKHCCLIHSFNNNAQQDQTIPSDITLTNPNNTNNNSKSYGTITVNGGGASSIDSYNKNDSTSARPLFDYTWTYEKKQCSQVGHMNEYDWCICDNGGNFSNNHCWCPMGAWQKDGKCICQPGTTKYDFYTGPSNSKKMFNCRNDEYKNQYTFSYTDDYTSHNDPDPDFVDWDDPLSVFWYHYKTSGEEIGMTFIEAFEQQQTRNKSSKQPIPKITIWKVSGIIADNGTKKVKIDVVGDSRCITPDANLDDNTGAECACSIKSVSTGQIQEKWVFNPLASFYDVMQKDRSPEGICRRTCRGKCIEAFVRDEYNVRYSLMKHWKP